MYFKYLTRYQDSEISLVPNDIGLLIVKVSKYIPFCRLLLAQSEQNIDKPTIFPRSPCGVFSLHIVGELGDAAKYQRSARQREVFLHILGQK